MLQEKDRKAIREILQRLANPVTLVYFTQTFECETCSDTNQLLHELTELSDKLKLEVYNFVTDKEKVAELGVDKVPALVLTGDRDRKIRYYGMPAGYEFASLLDDLLMLSSGDSGLQPASREKLKTLTTPVHLEVLVTPTWPYCPQAVRLAHQMAMESDQVTADMVEITEFPHLAQRYHVMGVPRTMINGSQGVDGAVPESAFVEMVIAAAISPSS